MKRLQIISIFVFIGLVAPIRAQIVDGSSPAQIGDILQEQGYRAKHGTDSQGDPKISSSSQGVSWTLLFYDCNEGKCDSVQFFSGFNLTNAISLSRINSWNRNKRYGSAYVDDDGDPFLTFDVNLDGGVTAANFRDTLDIWNLILGGFIGHIGWR